MADLLVGGKPTSPLTLTVHLLPQAIVLCIACFVGDFLHTPVVPLPLCPETTSTAPYGAAAVGFAVIAIPVVTSWCGYLPGWRRLLGYGTVFLWMTWALTAAVAVAAGTGSLGYPPCEGFQLQD